MTWKKLQSTVKYQNRYMIVTEDELIVNGTIKDGPTITALKYLEQYLDNK